MEKKSPEQGWGKVRQQGKRSFVWKQGVLTWGVTVAVLSSLIGLFLRDYTLVELLIRLFFSLIIFPVFGYFWGLWVWNLSEKRYQEKVQAEAVSKGKKRKS